MNPHRQNPLPQQLKSRQRLPLRILQKRPLKKLFVEDLKLHTVSEQYGSLLRIAEGTLGDENSAQQDEKYISRVNDYRYATRDMEAPQTLESWANMAKNAGEWFKKVENGEIEIKRFFG